MKTILMSVPHMSGMELNAVKEALASGWVSVLGPQIEDLEHHFSSLSDRSAAAVASGTAGLHLALQVMGVGKDDEVVIPSLTFVASANPVLYLGARPVFLDCDESWNLDPAMLEMFLECRAKMKRLPKAVMVVHLYGGMADIDRIVSVCAAYDVPLIEDATESLGAVYKDRYAGMFGDIGVYSFNGNKMITGSTGGMVMGSAADIRKVKKLRHQAKDDDPDELAYVHSEVGYNYGMSNIVAAIVLEQYSNLWNRVVARQTVYDSYVDGFDNMAGITGQPQGFGTHVRWLSCFRINAERFGCSALEVVRHLKTVGIEARRVWKPLHRQPLFKDYDYFSFGHGGMADIIFDEGICLPSSSSLTLEDQDYVISKIKSFAPKLRY